MKKLLALITLALVLVACASEQNFRQARIEVETGNEEQGLARLEQEVKAHPEDVELRNYYLRNKQATAERYLALGDNARGAGALERAAEAYGRVLRVDPQNQRAKSSLEALRIDGEQRRTLTEANEAFKNGQVAQAQDKLRDVLAQSPQNKEARALSRRIEEKTVRRR